jgi:hypothetical protein
MILLDLTEFNAQVNRLFTAVSSYLRENKQRAGSAADKLYQSVEAHLHVADCHDLRKKPTSMIKIKLLQLESHVIKPAL